MIHEVLYTFVLNYFRILFGGCWQKLKNRNGEELRGDLVYSSHFTDEKTQAQRGVKLLSMACDPSSAGHPLVLSPCAAPSQFPEICLFTVLQALSSCFSRLVFLFLFGCISNNVLSVATELLQLSVYSMGNLKLAWVKMGSFTPVIRNSKEMQQFNLVHFITAIKKKLNTFFLSCRQLKTIYRFSY